MDAPTRDAMALADEIMAFLRNGVADHGTAMDTGFGFGCRDFWVWVDGREFFISVKDTGKTRQADGSILFPDGTMR